jgi:4-amino-4-deoxy-L-arabinose transferase-like glycosyltransferase
VTLPIVLSFKLFGVGLLQARAVMVIFMLAFLVALFILGKKVFENKWLALASLALIVSFPPLYGNGKNVLGEVPGLFFLFVFLILIHNIWKGDRRPGPYAVAGLFLGLAIATKPIFILLVPAVVAVFGYALIRRRETFGDKRAVSILSLVVCTILPLITWVYIQFSGDSLSAIFAYYANPHKVNIAISLLDNIQAFFVSPQGLYFFFFLIVWIIGFVIRAKKKIPMSPSEWVALIFSLMIFVAYFRNPGYYRYFFLAEVFAIFFFAYSLRQLVVKWKWIVGTAVVLIIICQSYQLFFTSWVSKYYGSTKTRDCNIAISSIAPQLSIFFYQVPELVIFRKGSNYYQYMDSVETDATRLEKISVLKSGIPDVVVVSGETIPVLGEVLEKYEISNACERYRILERKAINI